MTSIEELARELYELRQMIAAQNAPQLGASSLDAGAIEHYDESGQLMARFGAQHDGTTAPVTFGGPVPPSPVGLDVIGAQESVTASWGGMFEDGAVAPMDFARVEVHRGTTEGFEIDPLPSSTTRVGTIEAVGGGSFTWTQEPGEVWVTLISRTISGKASEPQDYGMVEVLPSVDPEIFDQAAKDLEDARTRLAGAEDRLTNAASEIATNSADLDRTMKDLYEAGGRVDEIKTTLSGQIGAVQTTASGKNRVMWSTEAAPASATDSTAGDVWNQYTLADNRLQIIATWRSTGSVWESSALAESYLPQVNIGTGTYGELDGLRLKANSVQAGTVLVEGSVGSVLLADGAVTASKVAAESIGADKLVANTITSQQVNVEDLAAATGAIMKLDVMQLTATGTSTFATAVIDQLFAQTFAAHKITGDEVDARKLSGALAEFTTVKSENIQSGFLNASIGIGTTGAIMAGDWSKSYARIDDTGFSTYTVAEDGTQYMATSLGSAATNSLTIADSAGVTRASISPDGDLAANSVTVADDVSIAGADLIGQRLPYAGSSGASWLDTLPWALAGISNLYKTVAGRSVTASTSDIITPLHVVTATVWPGRTYQVTMPYAYYANSISSSSQAYLGLRAYYTVGSQAKPTPADPPVSGGGVGHSIRAYNASGGGGPISDSLVFTVTPTIDDGGPVQMKIMIASLVRNATMAYSLPSGASWLLTVQDIGPAMPDTGYPVGGPTVSQFVSQWKASTSRSYDKNGADAVADWRQGILRHGGDALTHSAFLCNDGAFSGEKGKTIAQALTGAMVTKVEIGVQSLYWANANGGTLTLLPFGSTSLPATDTNPGDPKKGVEKKFTTRSQWQWVTVPTSWITPTSTGVRLGPTWFYGTANQGYFANHNHPSAPPQIRVTYTRADKG